MVELGFPCRSFTVWQDEYVSSAWCRPDVAESTTVRMLRYFREGVMSDAVELCGVKRCSNQKEQTRWWNKEVKAAIRKKKFMYECSLYLWRQKKITNKQRKRNRR